MKKRLPYPALILALLGLTACASNADSDVQAHAQHGAAAEARALDTDLARPTLNLAFPELSAWVSQPGIDADERVARQAAAQVLTRRAHHQDTATYVHGDIDLRHARITSLPDGLVIEGNLDLSGSAIAAIDQRLVVRGDLIIEHTAIRALHASVRVGRDLKASDSGFNQITLPLYVGRHVELNHTAMQVLPDNLHVTGNLTLRGAPLAALPQELRVDGSLDIAHCPLTCLPDDLVVAADIDAAGTQLTGPISAAVLKRESASSHSLRTIDLRDTDLSYDTQAQLRLMQPTDTTILLGARYNASVHTAPEAGTFLVDDYIAAFRSQLPAAPQYDAIDIADWHLSTKHIDRIHSLLEHLHQVPGADAGPMAERVLSLFAQMQTDLGARQDVLEAIGSIGATTPQEAVAQLDEAELSALIANMGIQAASQTEIEALGMRVLHLQTVHHHANGAAARYSIQDVRRAQQTFDTYLRRALALPLNPKASRGPLSPLVTEAYIEQAAEAALAASSNPASLGAFLQTFAPYQRYQRVQAAQQARYASYPAYQSPHSGDAQGICPLTQTAFGDLDEPVTLKPDTTAATVNTVYELGAFLQFWSQTGTQPLTDHKIDLSALHRAVDTN